MDTGGGEGWSGEGKELQRRETGNTDMRRVRMKRGGTEIRKDGEERDTDVTSSFSLRGSF